MKYIKLFEKKNVYFKKIHTKLEELANLIKKLDDFHDSNITTTYLNKNSVENRLIIRYKKQPYLAWYLFEIELILHRGPNYKNDYIQIDFDTIYSEDFKEKERIKNILNFLDFFKINFNDYIITEEFGRIVMRIPIGNISNFYQELDNFYAYINSKTYNL